MSTTAAVSTHGAGCSCQRCIGFQPGNAAAVKHGARAKLMLVPRAEQIEEGLREVVPVGSPADALAISMCAMAAAQAERASIYLASMQAREQREGLSAQERETLRRLGQDCRGWANSVLRYLDALGLTPTARARLGLDIAATRRQLSVIDYYEDKRE